MRILAARVAPLTAALTLGAAVCQSATAQIAPCEVVLDTPLEIADASDTLQLGRYTGFPVSLSLFGLFDHTLIMRVTYSVTATANGYPVWTGKVASHKDTYRIEPYWSENALANAGRPQSLPPQLMPGNVNETPRVCRPCDGR